MAASLQFSSSSVFIAFSHHFPPFSLYTNMLSATPRNTLYLPSISKYSQFNRENERKFSHNQFIVNFSSKSSKPNPSSSISCELAADKLRNLVMEFQSLLDPIDRVKRLLQYADLLPPFDEAARLRENRVMMCTNQVWLDVSLDEFGRVRLRADSDSEIAKGFCSCLICVLDGAEPCEVLEVTAEDLVDLNVGLPSRSRVNTWENVLICMQNRTRDLSAGEREGAAAFGSYAASSCLSYVARAKIVL